MRRWIRIVTSRLMSVVFVAIVCATGCRHVAAQPLQALESAINLERRTLDDPEVHAFLVGHLDVAPTRWPLSRWGLQELTLAALYFQPSLAVAHASADATFAQVTTAAQRPNPALSISPQFVSNAATGASPWVATTQLSWTIETAGKRGDRTSAAESRAEAAEFAIRAEGWAIRSRTYAGVVTLVAAQARHRTLERALRAQTRLVELFEERLASGAVSQAELEPQRLALVRAAAGVAAAARQVLEARAGLAAALALPPAAVDTVEIAFPLETVPEGLEDLRTAAARRAALLGRSDVRALLSEYAAAEGDLRLELAKQYPDLRIGPGYEFDQGNNRWGLGVGVVLPIMNQNEGPIAEALARRRQVAARFDALQSLVIAQVGAASAKLEGSRRQWRQGQRLVVEATRQRSLAEGALALGAADRAGLVSADLERLAAEVVLIDAQEQFHLAAAGLEQAVQPARPFTPAVERDPSSTEPVR